VNLAVTAIGRDRPGIVAAITSTLLEAGGNVDDSQMSILHGHFAVMLICSVPEDASLDSLEARLDEIGRELNLGGITVSPVDDLDRGAGPTHVLTVYGADRPGIVHDTASTLAALGVNITDLRTRRTGDPESPLYTLMVEVVVPEGAGPELDQALDGLRDSKQLEASLAELESEVF
jgi:glycine cleavage system transcriptional repressor